ncbi:hypothetical protein AVEN_30225-1 [Araneus ventricosus]|uniref:Uncharacterized protein n=1 Tax=Araneus ventricosus TaxID=182803 RepID=A0A4Y2LEJ1_ARAVE|nr:hypothetical protein AVEN_30225-1 [Araneus ventricosus]
MYISQYPPPDIGNSFCLVVRMFGSGPKGPQFYTASRSSSIQLSSLLILAKDTISLTAGFTCTVLKPHSTMLSGQSFFQEEVWVLLVTPHFDVFSIILRQTMMWKKYRSFWRLVWR